MTFCSLILLGIACALLRFAGFPIATVVGMALLGAGAIFASRAIIAWRRRTAPHRSVLVFRSDGVSQRLLGTWTSMMPYSELRGVDCASPRRDGRREFRVHMRGAIVTLWAGGLVSLSDDEAHAVLEELRLRIEHARASR